MPLVEKLEIKKTKQTFLNQSTNYTKGRRQKHNFLPGLNERAVSFSVYHDCYSAEKWHGHRCETLYKYIAIMSGTVYLSFNRSLGVFLRVCIIVLCL